MVKQRIPTDPTRPATAQVIPLRRAVFVDEPPAQPSPVARLAPVGALLLAPVAAVVAVTILVLLGTLLFWALLVGLLCAAILMTGLRRGSVWSWTRRSAALDQRAIHPSSW
jgi:hypothetical protein